MLDREPVYLLLDEPTANLDETNSSLAENRSISLHPRATKELCGFRIAQSKLRRVGDRTLQMKDGAPRELIGETGKAEA